MKRTKHPRGWIRRRARRAVPIVTLGAAVAAGAAIAVPRLSPEDDAPAVAAVLETATATEADLSGNASVTGVVENATTIDVLHRIDGVTASATPVASEPAPAAVAPAVPAAFASTAATESTASGFASGLAIAPTDPTSTTTTTTTTTEPPTTSEPTATTTPTTATTVVPAPSTEPSVSTLPSLPATTTTTTTVEGDQSTDPAGRPAGGGGGGGAGATGGTLGSTGTAAATGDTAATVTERITSLPKLGETIDNGDVLYSVDGSPVVALVGEFPAWRTMSIDSEDGADITQLEESLVALGYGDGLTVDTEFDSETTAAVEAWQEGIGVEPTGEVPFGSIVFMPTDVTVTAIDAGVGDDVTAGDLIVSVSAATQSVVIDVAADQIGEFAVGQSVTIETGDGGDPIAGSVTSRQSVTTEDGTGVQATITPSAPLGVTDGVSVDVIVAIGPDVEGAIDTSTAALIPAEALVSRLDGTYAVEVRNADGTSDWIPVEVVQFNGSTVAVSGDGIAAGIDVLVPE